MSTRFVRCKDDVDNAEDVQKIDPTRERTPSAQHKVNENKHIQDNLTDKGQLRL